MVVLDDPFTFLAVHNFRSHDSPHHMVTTSEDLIKVSYVVSRNGSFFSFLLLHMPLCFSGLLFFPLLLFFYFFSFE